MSDKERNRLTHDNRRRKVCELQDSIFVLMQTKSKVVQEKAISRIEKQSKERKIAQIDAEIVDLNRRQIKLGFEFYKNKESLEKDKKTWGEAQDKTR